jgi:GNAT superfamily N-acetyltransferase
MLRTVCFHEARTFLDRVGPKLGTERVRYNLILGVSGRLLRNPHEYGGDDPWFLAVEDDGELAGLALRTPPYDILVAAFLADMAGVSDVIVREAASVFDTLPGVVGEPEIADSFARTWCDGRGVGIEHTMRQRVYGLTEVKPIRFSSGQLRQAGLEDRELVGRWVAKFNEDTFGHVDENRIVERADRMLERGDVYLWVDGEPVSIAARTRPTGDLITIGMVYTPPDFRKRGYASSCVATLCEHLLGSAYRYCALYTDLGNPTSNKIYKQIGFIEVCDSMNHTFTDSGLKAQESADA